MTPLGVLKLKLKLRRRQVELTELKRPRRLKRRTAKIIVLRVAKCKMQLCLIWGVEFGELL